MIRAISYNKKDKDKQDYLFVLEENDRWTLSAYPKGYSFLTKTLEKTAGVDYQRILPVHNGLGNSVMQQALRMADTLNLEIHNCDEVDSEDFADCFMDHYWLKSYVGGKLSDYIEQVKTDFPTEHKDLDEVVFDEVQKIHISTGTVQRIPLVNEFAWTFRKGRELKSYVLDSASVPPRTTGIIMPNIYHVQSGSAHNLIIPFIERNFNRNSSKKSLRIQSEIVKAFVRTNFWDNVSIHGLIIKDAESVYYERTF